MCTSPLQVISARAAMDHIKKANILYKDYIFIIHPLLTDLSKQIINKYSNDLNYEKCFDFDSLLKETPKYKDAKKLFYKIETQNSNQKDINTKKTLKFKKKSFLNKIFNKIKFMIKTKGLSEESMMIQKEIINKVGKIDEVFVRFHYGNYEQLFFDAFEKQPAFYAIEDGIGDYSESKQLKLSMYNILYFIRESSVKIILIILYKVLGFKKRYKPRF